MSQSISESNTSNYSLLGDNASPLEIALERVLSNALNDICPPIPELRNANKTPEHLLPYLALEKQVPEWESSDSAEQKRQTVKNQLQVYKTQGTRHGIMLALAGLGGRADIRPWYAYGGKPYQMQINYWITSLPPVDLFNRIDARISDAKSERDDYECNVGLSGTLDVNVAMFQASSSVVTVNPWYASELKGDMQISVGIAATSLNEITIFPGV